MAYRRYSTENKKNSYLQKPIVWTPKKLMKVQRRLTRWYAYKIRKAVFKILWDLWAVLLGIIAFSGATWMILWQAIFRR